MRRIDKKFPILYSQCPVVDKYSGKIIKFREPYLYDRDYYRVIKEDGKYVYESLDSQKARTFKDKQGNIRLAPEHRDLDTERCAMFCLGLTCLLLGIVAIIKLLARGH